jgi:hypothetical protein
VPDRPPTLRLLEGGRGLLCLLPLPRGADGLARELALVAAPGRPWIRRLTVYRRPGRDASPTDTRRPA